MADKSVMESIAKLKAERPRALLDVLDSGLCTMQNFTTAQGPLAAGLRFLVEDFRREADLVMDSGARGKGADATALRSTASALSLLADAVEKCDLDEPSTPPSRGGPSLPAEWCGDTEEHGPHDHDIEQGHPRLHCTGRRATDLTGLVALVASRAGVREPEKVIDALTQFVNPTATREPGDMEAYLRGDTNTMPPVRNDRESVTVEHGRQDELAAFTPAESDAFITPRVNTPELKAEAAAAMPMFANPTVPAGEPTMPGKRMTWAELRAPAPVAPPVHSSHSQATVGCGLQYRLSRLEPDVVEQPRWANVGGKAVHAAIEWYERIVAEAGTAQHVEDRVQAAAREWGAAPGDLNPRFIWQHFFREAIVAQALECPQVGQKDWKASGRGGSEGYTWWLGEGEDMLLRYMHTRKEELKMVTPPRLILEVEHTPMIEHAGVLDVEGEPTEVVIDQVWTYADRPGTIVVDDVKAGATAPNGTFQLGLYAWYLRKELGWEGDILGRFWNARKGEYSQPVDLIAAHPWDEIVMRVHGEQAKKRAGIFTPQANYGNCGPCMVSHACPAAVLRG